MPPAAPPAAALSHCLRSSAARLPALATDIWHLYNMAHIDNLPRVVKRRVNALKNLQVKCAQIETKFYEDTSAFLPGESHGLRILVGYSPCGPKRAGHNN